MTLHLGGKTIELIYVDHPYNPGDIAVVAAAKRCDARRIRRLYRPPSRHPAGLQPRHHDGDAQAAREALSALKPKVMVPAHGPLGDAKDLHALTDYLLLARQKVRTMMAKGLSLEAITKGFHMNEYKGWDRENHFEWLAETLHRELRGEGPQIVPISDRQVKGTIRRAEDEGRRLVVKPESGQDVRLRVTADTDIDGAATDRSQLKVGMKLTAKYQVPEGFNAALGYDVTEMVVAP